MLFKPLEVKVTCRNIDAFLQADNGICIDAVRAGAIALASDTDKVVHSIRVSGMSSEELALTLIYNVLLRNLQSGSFHVYRGILSMQGRDMLRLWHATAKEMVRRGYSSAEEYQRGSSGIAENIRLVG